MEGFHSILKTRLCGSTGDLNLSSDSGRKSTSYCPPRRRVTRVNFSRTNEVRFFDTSWVGLSPSSKSSSMGALDFNRNSSDGACAAGSIERLVRSEDVDILSPYINRSIPTNHIENSENERERTGSERSMSISEEDIFSQSHENSFFENSVVQECGHEISAAIDDVPPSNDLINSPTISVDKRLEGVSVAEVASETLGSDNTVNMSVEDVSCVSQESFESTNSSIRDMPSVEEHSNNPLNNKEHGPSSQLMNSMDRLNEDLAKRVFIRDENKIQYEGRPAPMYFGLPNPQLFRNPFRSKEERYLNPKTPPNTLSFGKFGCAKTPRRLRIRLDRPPPTSQLQRQTKNEVAVQTSPTSLDQAPPLRTSRNDIGLDCKLDIREWMNSFTTLVYSSTSIPPRSSTHEPELPVIGSVAAAPDTYPTTVVETATPLNTIPNENEAVRDCDGSYSHSDDSSLSNSILASSTNDEEESSSLQSSPPSVIAESEELLETSIEYENLVGDEVSNTSDSVETIRSDEDEDDSRSIHEGEVVSINNFWDMVEGLPTPNLGLVSNGCVPAIPTSSNSYHDQSQNTSSSSGTIVDANVEEEECVDENKAEEAVVKQSEKVGEEENGEEEGMEVPCFNYVYNRGANQGTENLRSLSFKEPQIDSSQLFEQSCVGRQSESTQNEVRIMVGEESTLSAHSNHPPSPGSQPPAPAVDQTNQNTQQNNEVLNLQNSLATFSPAFQEIFEQLQEFSGRANVNVLEKWAFFRDATDKLSSITELEWEALLKHLRIKEFMGDTYIRTIEICREIKSNPDPLYRGAMNFAAEMKRRHQTIPAFK